MKEDFAAALESDSDSDDFSKGTAGPRSHVHLFYSKSLNNIEILTLYYNFGPLV